MNTKILTSYNEIFDISVLQKWCGEIVSGKYHHIKHEQDDLINLNESNPVFTALDPLPDALTLSEDRLLASIPLVEFNGDVRILVKDENEV